MSRTWPQFLIRPQPQVGYLANSIAHIEWQNSAAELAQLERRRKVQFLSVEPQEKHHSVVAARHNDVTLTLQCPNVRKCTEKGYRHLVLSLPLS